MNQMKAGGMWEMGVAGFILRALVVLLTATLVKFVFFKDNRSSEGARPEPCALSGL
jgi:hypothetical protein